MYASSSPMSFPNLTEIKKATNFYAVHVACRLGGFDGFLSTRASATNVNRSIDGEGYGDTGWVAQTEVRYAVGPVVAYLFYDAGRVTLNKSPWTTQDNHRALAGGGIGVRYVRDAWSGGLTVAWRSHGGASVTDDATHSPSVLATVAYRF